MRKINWHTVVASAASVVGWVGANVNVSALPHWVGVVVGVLGLVFAAQSEKAVTSK